MGYPVRFLGGALRFLLVLFLLVLPAGAGVMLTGVTPMTFSGPGETITFQYRLERENIVVNGMTLSGSNLPISDPTCTPDFPLEVNGTAICTATYITTESDISDLVQFGGTYELETISAPRGGAIASGARVIYKGSTGEPAAPEIVSVSPDSGPAIGGTVVTITGTDLTGATAVSFGTWPATSFTVDSAMQITATTPGGAAGPVDVTVTTPGGTAVATGAFTYMAPVMPVLSIDDVAITEGDSGVTVALFTISLDRPVPQFTTVTYDIATADGTAIAGEDYIAVSDSGSIGPGSVAGSFAVQISGDTDPEPDENFFVNVTNVSGATVADAQGIGTITNDDAVADAPVVSWSVPGGTATEAIATVGGVPLSSGDPVPSGSVVEFQLKPSNGGTYTQAPTGCGIQYISSSDAGDLWRTGPVTADCAVSFMVQWIELSPPNTERLIATHGQFYSLQFTIGNSYGPFNDWSWSFARGALPAGLELDAATGLVSGIPEEAGEFSFGIQARNGAGHYSWDNYRMIVAPASPTIAGIAPDTGPAAGGTVVTISGTDLTGATAVTFGGTAATDFTVGSATQITATTPAGSTGAVDVTVTTPGGIATATRAFTYEEPASADASLSDLAASTGTLAPNFAPGTVAYAVSVPYAVTSLTLTPTAADAGATITVAGQSVMSGSASTAIPLMVGDTPIEIVVTAEDGAATRIYTVTATREAPVITLGPDSLPQGVAGSDYGPLSLTAEGGTAPYIFTLVEGALPEGLALGPGGQLSGIPWEAGSFDITVMATGASNFTGTRDYRLIIDAPVITLGPDDLPGGEAGAAYGPVSFVADGGTEPYSFALTGELPEGLKFEDGALSGTPVEAGSFSFTVAATDAYDFVAERDYRISIDAPQISLGPDNLPDGVVYADYSQNFTANGGTGPYSFKVTAGDLPNGLMLAPDGVLTGVPTEDGAFPITITATDDNGFTGTRDYSFAIAPPEITLGPESLPKGTGGAEYGPVRLTAEGGDGAYEFTATAATLPAGLTLTPDGALSGIPGEDGSFTFSVTATDQRGFSGQRDFTLSVDAPEITLGPDDLPNGVAGMAYDELSFTAAGGRAPYGFTLEGQLPNGMSFKDGILSGTPSENGDFALIVTATDADNFTGQRSYTLRIDAPGITLLPGSLSEAAVYVDYSVTFSARGGKAPYSYEITEGDLPQDMSFENGTLSGTPTEAGSFPITVSVADDNGFTTTGNYTLSVTAPKIVLAPDTLPEGTVYADYSGNFSAKGGDGTYSYKVTGGSLPEGLELAAEGRLTGTPAESGDFPFTVTVTDGKGFTGTGDYTLAIATPDIALAPRNLPDGIAGTEYEPVKFTAEGGEAPYDFTLSGKLPDGLNFKGDTLSGVPARDGAFTFTVTATDAGAFAGEREYTLRIRAPEITIGPDSLPNAAVYADYSESFIAEGGTGSYRYEMTDGDLPGGMKLAADGTLSGQPGESGEFAFTITATDDNDFAGAREYTLIVEAPKIALSPKSLPVGTAGMVFGPVNFTAKGGDAPYSFMLDGDLPEGLDFRDGTLSGTPTVAGEFAFTVSATDPGEFSGEREYRLTIAAPDLVLTPGSLPAGRVNTAYDASLEAEGGTAPYGFAVTQGSLPEGLALAEDGTLSGTPSEPGGFSVTMTVTDRFGFTGSRDYMIAIEDIALPQPQNHELTVMAGTDGTIDLTLGAMGGPFTKAAIVANPAHEAGMARIASRGGRHILHFSASGGYAGTTSLRYTLSNAGGISEPASVMITVVARPDPSLDPEVIGLVRAQTETAKRFAKAQIRNFGQRLEQLHDEGTRRRNSLALNLTAQSSRGDSDALSLRGPEAFGNQRDELAFWSSGYVNFGSRDDGAIDLDHTLIGVSAGADYRFTPKFTAGLGLGYGRDVTDIGSNGTESRAEAFSLAAYGSYRPKPGFFIDGLAGYSSLNFDSKRYVTWTGDMATGTRRGEQYFAALTAGYELRRDGVLISPYGRLSGSRSTLDMFTENGGGVYNLTYDEQIVKTLSGTLGLRFEQSRPTGWGQLTSRARFEYTHEFENSSQARLGYADLGTLPYIIDADGFSRDQLAIGLGFDAQIGELWTLGLDYRTAFGTDGDSQDHTVAFKLDVRF